LVVSTSRAELYKARLWRFNKYIELASLDVGFPIQLDLRVGRGAIGYGPLLVGTEVWGLKSLPGSRLTGPSLDWSYEYGGTRFLPDLAWCALPLVVLVAVPVGYDRTPDGYYGRVAYLAMKATVIPSFAKLFGYNDAYETLEPAGRFVEARLGLRFGRLFDVTVAYARGAVDAGSLGQFVYPGMEAGTAFASVGVALGGWLFQ